MCGIIKIKSREPFPWDQTYGPKAHAKYLSFLQNKTADAPETEKTTARLKKKGGERERNLELNVVAKRS